MNEETLKLTDLKKTLAISNTVREREKYKYGYSERKRQKKKKSLEFFGLEDFRVKVYIKRVSVNLTRTAIKRKKEYFFFSLA